MPNLLRQGKAAQNPQGAVQALQSATWCLRFFTSPKAKIKRSTTAGIPSWCFSIRLQSHELWHLGHAPCPFGGPFSPRPPLSARWACSSEVVRVDQYDVRLRLTAFSLRTANGIVGVARNETRGVTQVLVHVSTYQGSILEFRFLEPQPCGARPSPSSSGSGQNRPLRNSAQPAFRFHNRTSAANESHSHIVARRFMLFEFFFPLVCHC